MLCIQQHASPGTAGGLYCRYAVSGDNSGMVLVWNMANGSCIMKLQAHTAPVIMCDMSRDCTRAMSLDAEGKGYLWYLDMQVSGMAAG